MALILSEDVPCTQVAPSNTPILNAVVFTVHAFAKANPPPIRRATPQGMRADTVFQSSKLGISMTSSIELPEKY